jgi:hypothetical protein
LLVDGDTERERVVDFEGDKVVVVSAPTTVSGEGDTDSPVAEFGWLVCDREGVLDFDGVLEGEDDALSPGDEVSDNVGDGDTDAPIDKEAVGVLVSELVDDGDSLTDMDAEGDSDIEALSDFDEDRDEDRDMDSLEEDVTEIVGVFDDDREIEDVFDEVRVSLGVLVSDLLMLLVFVVDRVIVMDRDAVGVSEGLRDEVGVLEFDRDSLGVLEDDAVVPCIDGWTRDRHSKHTKIVRKRRPRPGFSPR